MDTTVDRMYGGKVYTTSLAGRERDHMKTGSSDGDRQMVIAGGGTARPGALALLAVARRRPVGASR